MATSPRRLSTAATRLRAAPRWALVALTALAAVALRAALQPVIGDQMPFFTAYPAVVFAAVVWGIGPGLAVGAACAAAVASPWIPPNVAAGEGPLQIGAFAVVAIVICLTCNFRGPRAPADPSGRGSLAGDTPLAVWLRAVLWGSVLVPFVAFVAASWWGYERAVREAEAAADRAAVLVRGQAEHTFDVARAIALRADVAASDADAEVRANERAVHGRLADMVAGVPSVVNLNVWDENGRPLARSDRYPTDQIASIADRAYFVEQRASGAAFGISEVLVGRQTGQELMNATLRRRSPDGSFRGVVAVSLSPQFFRDYFRSLAAENPTLARFALVRDDGAILAGWPHSNPTPKRVADNDPALARVLAGDVSGHLETRSRQDGQQRFVSFQRVGRYPAYVVAGVSRSAMLAGWLHFVGLLAALLVPITAGLTWVSLVALRKTGREQAITAELAEADRRRAAAEKGMLESQKLETLAQLTGGVAHDFNNLLAIISSSLHVHRHLHPALAGERHLEAMSRAVLSGTRLTRQLLSFSRRQALRPETIALQSWLPGAEGLLRSTLGSRIEMAIRVEADVRSIQVDVAEFELALINLALNARHAMPTGGRLTVEARNLVDAGRAPRVVVAVGDTGSGIPADVLPRVFEPFFTTRPRESGSGLGLSQVHGFCAQADGEVRIASVVGQGTTVEMVLPAVEPASPEPVAPDAVDARAFSGRVLLVEDNEDVAVSTMAILQASGLDVTHWPSADAAWGALKGGATLPDVVLSDIEMPGRLSGMDLAFRLRETWPRLPVVLITGYAKQLDDAVAGGLHVLPKPTPPIELLRVLRAAMAETAVAADQPPR